MKFWLQIWLHKFKFKFKWNLNRNSNFPPILWHLGYKSRPCVYIFSTLIIWKLNFRFQSSFRAQNFVLFSSSPFIHLLLPPSSYPWLPMVVSLSLTHFLLEVTSPITFPPSPFCCHWSSRSKGFHWWRRSKAYNSNGATSRYNLQIQEVVSHTLLL